MIESAEEFVRLIDSEIESDRSLAITEEASEDAWSNVSKNYPDYEIYILQNETISLTTIKSLSRSPNSRVRWEVAQKRRSGPDVFNLLSKDEDTSVRKAVAANKKTPHDTLTVLCSDTDERVRHIALHNINHRKWPKTSE